MNRCMRFRLGKVGVPLLCLVASQQFSSAQVNLSLSWNYPSTNETGFGIQRATSPDGPWKQIATVAAPTTSYVESNLQYSTTYYYQTWAYNAAGDSPLSSIASITTPAGFGVQLSVPSPGQIKLTVTGLTGLIYNIQASQDLKSWTTIGSLTAVVDGLLNFTDTNAVHYSRRFYRVQQTQLL
jgi:hypothetical protein